MEIFPWLLPAALLGQCFGLALADPRFCRAIRLLACALMALSAWALVMLVLR